MKIAFTICSNNYLAHAKTLIDSFLNFHPDVSFKIGLVDKLSPEVNYDVFTNIEIIEAESLNIPEWIELLEKYNITELNTSIKPSLFLHLYKKYDAESIIYIDPDIMVFDKFEDVYKTLISKDIILTPHIMSPVDDDHTPTDYHTLRGGVFNLGFIALGKFEKVETFLKWWHDRVVKYGFCNFEKNMFYDQLWINYVPVMFDNYHILKHPGYNMANWNLHERILSKKDDIFYVNKSNKLVFFHFSSYKFKNPQIICGYNSRFNFDNRPDLKEIFDIYQSKLILNQAQNLSSINCIYFPPKVAQTPRLQIRIKNKLKRMILNILTN